MYIPRYWANETQHVIAPSGKAFALKCWRGSNTSLEEARHLAKDAITAIAQNVRTAQQLDRYSYGERPMREEVLDVIHNQEGAEVAILTRNKYGALVLNTANVMFIDIDFARDAPAARLSVLLRNLFGQPATEPAQKYLESIESWARARPDWAIRVYRTRAGLRCLVTHDVFDPTLESTSILLKSLQCDPLYMLLCRNQGCFRARLTPKPWRCGAPRPPSSYPWENQDVEWKYRQWEKRYEQMGSKFATCKLVKEIGPSHVHPNAEIVRSLHDHYACSSTDLKLA